MTEARVAVSPPRNPTDPPSAEELAAARDLVRLPGQLADSPGPRLRPGPGCPYQHQFPFRSGGCFAGQKRETAGSDPAVSVFWPAMCGIIGLRAADGRTVDDGQHRRLVTAVRDVILGRIGAVIVDQPGVASRRRRLHGGVRPRHRRLRRDDLASRHPRDAEPSAVAGSSNSVQPQSAATLTLLNALASVRERLLQSESTELERGCSPFANRG